MRKRVALVGIGLRAPGASDPHALWRTLLLGEDTVASAPVERAALAGVTRGGFIDGLERFDHHFFAISTADADALSPAARKLLEVVWDACEDAGLQPSSLRERRVGTYVGAIAANFERPHSSALADVVGQSHATLATRISYTFGLRGPSVVIDTDRSSSLVALDSAVRDVHDGRVDVALVCGANTLLEPSIGEAFDQAGLLSPEGACRFGSAEANGFVRSEGVGCVVLMPEAAAREAGRRVYSVIVGTAVNHDAGRGRDFVTPSNESQRELLHEALRDAQISASEIGYIEAHGTGTPVGDTAELTALHEVFGGAPHPVYVGSVKSNIGHTEGAAGLFGVIKTSLALSRNVLPSTLHIERPSASIAWEQSALRLAREHLDWPVDVPRRAGVSAFGLTGTNAHCVLEAAEHAVQAPPAATTPAFITLSAHNEDALRALAGVFASSDALPPLASLSSALRYGREQLSWRLIGQVNSSEEAKRGWRAHAEGGAGAMQVVRALNTAPRIVLVCPGQGAQWLGMGRVLWEKSAAFREAIGRVDVALHAQFGWRVSDALHSTDDLQRIDRVQTMLFAMSLGLWAEWQARGLRCDAVIGSSMGEVAAAVIAGALTLEQGVTVIAYRSALLATLRGRGSMLSVLGERAWVEHWVATHPALAVAVYNGPASTVVAGATDAIIALEQAAQRAGWECRRVQVDVASHSPEVDSILDTLEAGLQGLRQPTPSPLFFSTVTCRRGEMLDAVYWRRNLREPVRLEPAITALLDEGFNTFVELSPHEMLTGAIADTAAERNRDAIIIGSMRRDEPADATLEASSLRLQAAGVLPVPAVAQLTWPGLPARPWQGTAFSLRHAPIQPRASTQNKGQERELSLAERLRAAGPIERQRSIVDLCTELVRSVLRWPSDRAVPTDRGFRDLGLSSLMMVEVRNRLARTLGVTLPATYFFERPTIDKVAADLAKEDAPSAERTLLGDILVDCGIVSREQISQALAHQARTGERLGEALLRLGLVTPEQLQRALTTQLSEPVAIVGMALRFPGGASSPESFWRLLRQGKSAITPPPSGRSLIGAPPGGFIDGIDRFDFEFFGISRAEAERMDPQQRLLLELSWHAFEHAGIDPDRLRDSATGVFVGVSNYNEYARAKQAAGSAPSTFDGVGDATSIIAGRLAYQYGFRGPTIAVDTACSSSLVALHLASQSLKNQECKVALAAGVNIILTPHVSSAFQRAHMLASDGRCKTFDARADGYVRSEGGAVLVLKTLTEARRAGDRIWALVDATNVNQDGRSAGLTAPNGEAQEALIKTALHRALLQPSDVQYVEAHGTGTRLGDPIEVNALARVYGEGRSRERPLLIGSVKSNLGHLEAAAGMAGVIKVVMAMQQAELPPSLHVEQLNPAVDWQRHPVRVVTKTLPWPKAHRRLAGVSSFGFSGTNAHVLLETYSNRTTQGSWSWRRSAHPVILTGPTPAAIDRVAAAWAAYVREHPDETLEDIAHTLNCSRHWHPVRLGFAAQSRDELLRTLEAIAKGDHERNFAKPAPVTLSFGASHSITTGLGAALYEQSPTYRTAFESYLSALETSGQCTGLLAELLQRESPMPNRQRTLLAFTAAMALHDSLRVWGFEPTNFVGTGIGVICAGLAAGRIELQHATAAVWGLLRGETADLIAEAAAGEQDSAMSAAPLLAAIAPDGKQVLLGAGPEWPTLCAGIAWLVERGGLDGLAEFDSGYGYQAVTGALYPFAATRAWYAAAEERLLGERTDAADGRILFRPSVPDLFDGHRVGKHAILPAAAYAELGFELLTALGEDKAEVTHIEITRPLRLQPGVELVLHYDPDGRRYHVNARQEANGELQRVGGGQLTHCEDRRANPLPRHVRTMRTRSPVLDPYAALAHMGLDYRGAFRQIEHVWLGDGEVYATLAATDPQASAEMDACLQVAVLAIGLKRGLHLPVGIERAWRQSRQSVKSVHAQFVERTHETWVDVRAYDAHDDPVFSFERVRLLPTTLPAFEAQIAASDDAGKMLRAVHWRSAERAASGAARSIPTVCYSAHGGDLAVRLAGMLGCQQISDLSGIVRATALSANNVRVVYVAGADDNAGQIVRPLFEGVQLAVTLQAPIDWVIITSGAQPIDETPVTAPVSAALWGLMRVAQNEEPGWRVQLIDADVESTSQVAAEIVSPSDEQEVGFRAGVRYVPRLERRQASWLEVPSGCDNYVLQCGSKGRLDTLTITPTARQNELGARQVEIAVEHLGLNFRDVLNALGAYPGEAGELGGDVSGIIARVGSAVTRYRVGDRVYGFALGGARRYVAVDERLVSLAPVPTSEAATLISTFLTAELALLEHAQLAAGERVLIHAAAGGVGLAALAVARAHGAEIYATASVAKHAFLRSLGIKHVYDSRTTGFYDAIMRDTHGAGVHVVLNSLTDDKLTASLRLLGAGGRFIEIGKQTLHTEASASKLAEKPIRYQAVALDALATTHPDWFPAAFERITAAIEEGVYMPLRRELFALGDAERAFRQMANGKHIGKVVLRMRDIATAAEGSCVITGGLGGIGLTVAHWLAARGVRDIVLLGRSPANEEQMRAIDAIRAIGAHVLVEHADVTDVSALRAIAQAAEARAGGVACVVHAAGLLTDSPLATLTWDDFERSFAPKVGGALAIQQAFPSSTRVMYCSSVTALLGNPGQANYAAANAVLDALAQTGNAHVSVAWPAWNNIGMARDGRAVSSDLPRITLATALRVLERTLAAGHGAITVWSEDPRGRLRDAVARRPLFGLRAEVTARSDAWRAVIDLAEPARSRAAQTRVREALRSLLGTGAELPGDKPLMDLGVDSLTALELRHRLAALVGRDLPSTVVFDHPSIDALAQFLLGIATPVLVSSNREQAHESIAVIGMQCRFPGGANDAESYWALLRDQRSAIREVPAARWNIDALYDPDPDAPGKMSTRYGGFLEAVDIAAFDPEAFGIAPREAMTLDPQQRLVLETVWEAFEDAGLRLDRMAQQRVGVFLGISTQDYAQQLAKLGLDTIDPYRFTGNAFSVAAGRISYVFGFTGPAMAIDTACSSSLYAVHQARRSLLAGECDVAVVAGVNLLISPDLTVYFSKSHFMAPDGQCKTFDAAADGYVRGEGCGVLILKRRSSAERDGDRIRALIPGSAVNQDGRSGGLTVPNGPAQTMLIQEALHEAGLAATDVDYVEAHGTGTSLGDPIELRALAEAYGRERSPATPLLVGSVKTNLGHLEAASGMASLIKVILALEHDQIPGQRNLLTPSNKIAWSQLPVSVLTQSMPWARGPKPRHAGVSAFAFQGSNAHVIVEEPPLPTSRPARRPERPVVLLTTSAKSAASLRLNVEQLLVALRSGVPVADAAYTAGAHRAHYSERLALVAADAEEAIAKLEAYVSGDTQQVARGRATETPMRLLVGPPGDLAEDPRFLGETPSAALIHLLASYGLDVSVDPAAPPVSDWRTLFAQLAVYYVAGGALDFDAIDEPWTRRLVSLPHYQFHRQRYWALPEPAQAEQSEPISASLFYDVEWRQRIAVPARPLPLPSRALIVGDENGVGAAVARELRACGSEAIEVGAQRRAVDEALARGCFSHVLFLRSLDVVEAVQRTADLLGVVQALLTSRVQTQLVVVTRGATERAAALDVAQACIWGFARVVASEHPELRCRRLDIDATTSDANALARTLLHELTLGDDEDEAAVVGNTVYVPRLVHAAAPAPARPLALRSDATYLITGGLGSIGLRLAERFIERGAHHLVLVGRQQPSAAAQASLAVLNARGADIQVKQVDISSPEDVKRLFAGLATKPPLRGIVHAAGTLQPAAIVDENEAGLRAKLAAKVQGAWLLHQASAQVPLDFFVMFSSLLSFVFHERFAAYAAGNCYLDALAHLRRRQQLPALSINWGGWSGSTMMADRELGAARAGADSLSFSEALDAFETALARPQAQQGIFRVDWSALSTAFYAEGAPPLLRELTRKPEPPRPATDALANLLSLPAYERKDALLRLLQQVVGSVLGLRNGHAIDVSARFMEHGLDSLLALELRNRLLGLFDVKLPATVALDHPTVEALATRLIDALPVLGSQATPPTTEQPAEATSDDDLAAQQLAAELELIPDRWRSTGR